MRIDRVIADLGIAAVEDLSDEARDHLTDEMEAFLRSGGVFSWTEWGTLTSETQDAARTAGNRIRWESAGMIGASVRSEALCQSFLSGKDPAEVAVRKWLKASADKLEGDVRKGATP